MLMGAVACGPGQADASRCASVAELFETNDWPVRFADTTGDGVPEAWGFESRSEDSVGVGLVRDADGRYVPRLAATVDGRVRTFADVDGDGREDLVVEPKLDVEGSVWRVYGSDEKGVPGELIDEAYFGPVLGSALDYLDVDGDGRADFIAANGAIVVDLATGAQLASRDGEIATNSARVLVISPGWMLVTNGDMDAPGLDILEVTDAALELRYRGSAPAAFGFEPAVSRPAEDRVSFYPARKRDEGIDLIRLDIDLATGTADETLLATDASHGRAADLDGDTHLDVAWIDAATRELRVRFGRDDEELGGTQAFPEIGTLGYVIANADLEGTGASQLVRSREIDDGLRRFEAIALAACAGP